MATMKDIAQKAGVSQATVSRVLNGSDNVRSDTKKLIMNIAKEMGYSQNIAARTLLTKKSFLIGVVLPNITNPFFGDILNTIEDEAYNHGYEIIFMSSNENEFREKKCIDSLIRRGVDGIIIAPFSWESGHLDILKNSNIPSVSVTRIIEDMNAVAVSHHRGGELVARHFASLGHTSVAYLGSTGKKFEGYSKELNRSGISLDKKNVFEPKKFQGPFKDRIRNSLDDYLDRYEKFDFTAIFVGSDLMALEVIHLFREKGFRVPEDIAVVGFDNTFFSRSIGISSVSQPVMEISSIAFNMLLSKVDEKTVSYETQHVELLPRLIPRGSSMSAVVTSTPKEK